MNVGTVKVIATGLVTIPVVLASSLIRKVRHGVEVVDRSYGPTAALAPLRTMARHLDEAIDD